MLRIRDISLRHRLLVANFTMVFVPIAILTVLGFLLISGLRFSSPHNDLTTLWPEKGPALSIQYTVSSLRVKAERPGPLKVKDMREDCQALEELGIATAIVRNDQVAYVTPGIDFRSLADRVLWKAHGQQTVMTWDGDGFFFRYTSPHSGTTVIAAGNTPFIAKSGIREGMAKSVIQTLLLFIVGTASAIIIACGLIVSRVLSRQILTPLAALRTAAAEIEKGNLDYELTLSSHDELGRTCEAFDHMRRQLRSARLAQEKLVDRLFLFSKLDLGQVSFTMEPVSLRDYFADFTAENTARLAERGLILHYTPPSGPARTAIDRMQFQRVLDNLLENALKYKQCPTVNLDLHLAETGQSVVLTVADDGPGVPAADLPRLFDSFYRTDAARTDVKKGSGDLEIYVDKHRFYVKGQEISLTNREFELLVFLAKHPGLVFSRDRLFERVWGLDAEGDTATVMVHINRIREKNRTGPGQADLHRDRLGCRIPVQRMTDYVSSRRKIS